MHLSEQMMNDTSPRVGTASVPAGAPDDEIEITPAMIEAGAKLLIDRLGFLPEMSPGIAEDLALMVLEDALAVRRGESVQGQWLAR